MNGEVDEAGEQGGSRPKHTHHCGSSRGPSAASGGFERRGRGQRLCTAQPLGQRHRSPAPPHMKPPPGGMPGCRKPPPVSASSTLCTKGSPPAAPPKPAGMPGMPGMPKPGMAPPPPPPMSPGPATGGGGGGGRRAADRFRASTVNYCNTPNLCPACLQASNAGNGMCVALRAGQPAPAT